MKDKVIILHHNDPDGYLSNYLVRGHHPYDDIKSISMSYEKETPFDLISKHSTVYILDFSIPVEDMYKMIDIEGVKIIWIDHHKTSIDKYVGFPWRLDGIREIGKCGAMLTSMYLNRKEKNIPYDRVLELVNDWDCWHFGKEDFDPSTKDFIFGIQIEDLSQPKVWDDIYKDIHKYINCGKTIRKYNRVNDDYTNLKNGFEIIFEGYNCFACNTIASTSEFFGQDKLDKYDILIPFCYLGKDKKWKHSLYSNKETIDCSFIAKKYGGGGHRGAAGFISTEQIIK